MNTNDSPRPTPRQCADDQTVRLPPYPFRRASGSRDPLLLCETCTRIPIDSIPGGWRYARRDNFITHHHNFISLLESVWSGCELCAVFLDGYLDEWCKWENVDREAARLSNLRLDHSTTPAFIIGPNLLHPNLRGQRNELVGIRFQRQCRNMAVRYFISQPDLENCKPADTTFVHREVSPYPDFEIAKDWIRQCRDAHSQCWSDQLDPPLLPTRVIDVGPDDGAQEPRLLVVPDGMRGRYVSLSHCWGDTKPLTTTTSNLHSHQELIPFGLLPLTFQHAVLATRYVGIRYLWIDSLCIVQDSKDDWQAECGKMTEVYVRSTVTVAAAAALDSNAGFLHRRGDPQYATHVWQLNGQPRSSRNRFLIRRADSNPVETANDTEMSSPLASRAWIYQEMFLSTRVLYFGSRKMYWQCETAAQFENLLFPTLGDYGKQGKGVGSAPPPLIKREPTYRSQDDLFRYQLFYPSNTWYQIVTEYSKRQLTHNSDKLPAISGVARWLWSADAENYLAGLIRGDLRRGLGWICSPSGGKVLATPAPPRRPSWSWIATDGPVDFFHEVFSLRLSTFQFWRDPSDPEFLSATTVKLSPDPFGAVAGGILRLRAYWKMASVDVAPSDQTPDRTVALLGLCDPENTDEPIPFFPDNPSLWTKGDMVRCVLLASRTCWWYAMVVDEDALASTAPPEDQNANIGGDSSETVSENSAKKIARVRRVGVAGGYTKPGPLGLQVPKWWSGAVRAELEIV